MRRIIELLSALTVMVTLSSAFAEERPQFTPEEHELAGEVLNELGGVMWEILGPWLVFDEFAQDGPMDIDDMLESGFEELRPLLKIELLFARKVCDLSETEFESLSNSSEDAMKEAVRQLLIQQQAAENDKGPPVDESQLPRLAPDVVWKVAECQLTPSQWTTFVAERHARTAQRKRVTILNLVTRLDADLLLSAGQREQLSKLFETHWDETWGHSLQSLTNEAKFIPPLPQDEVDAILSKTQLLAWSERQYDSETSGWENDPLGLLAELDEAVMADEEDSEPGEETETTDKQPLDD